MMHSKSGIHTNALIVLGIVQLLMLLHPTYHDGFTSEEVAHLSSGVFHWEQGNFGMFNVNPPLVRMVATIPVMMLGYEADWSGYSNNIAERGERPEAIKFLELNGQRSYFLLRSARLMCIPFTLLGMWVCWMWAGELYGHAAALLAAAMWCFSPNILGHGHLIAPEIAATSLGIAAMYTFRRWLISPTWREAVIAGLVFGQAQAAKSSWIVLFAMWPALWLMWRWLSRKDETGRSMSSEFLQLGVMLILGICSINAWYGFHGTFTRLGEYQFLSKALGGVDNDMLNSRLGNRFKNTWLASVPVPLPSDYVQGIDRQKYHFERPDSSYLAGEWRDKGWWHYYVYATFVKEPTGYWILGEIALLLFLTRQAYRTQWKEELLLWIPFLILVVFISSQRGFNRHLRYILPAYPLAFILTSRIAISFTRGNWKLGAVTVGCLTSSIVSSLMAYPHSLGYFNELSGGPLKGHYHLNSSNTDCGQDLLYLKRWIDAHPEARPLYLSWSAPHVRPELAEVEFPEPPEHAAPGWYAISVNQLHTREGRYARFLDRTPVATAGYSIFIYHLTQADRPDANGGANVENPVSRHP